MNVMTLADRLRDESDAYKFVEELRWGDGDAECPHCGNLGASYIRPMNGASRKTRTGAASQRRVWRCLSCRKQFSVITGTCMHGTKVALRVWVLCIFEMVASKNGVSAREIERKYGVCPRTAWHLMHRIREAMKSDGLIETMRGAIVADETYFGGKYANKHARQREGNGEPVVPGKPTFGGKTPVFSLINTTTGEARSRVVADVTSATLSKVIAEQVDMAGSTLMTDANTAYLGIGLEFISHESVNHSEDEYVRYDNGRVITSNQAENFFSQLKRSIDGTHHHVSAEHLGRYVAEFDFRFSTRKISDEARMRKLMGQTGGKRLTYKRVTA